MTRLDSEDIFPVEDVAASAADAELQRGHQLANLDPEERENLDHIRTSVLSDGAPVTAEWIYFSSPEWTWSSECGREGWVLYDGASEKQHAFVMTVMN